MQNSVLINQGLQIDSMQTLFVMLNKYPALLTNTLKKFKNTYYLFLYGCNCNREEKEKESIKIYKDLDKIHNSEIENFKKYLNVSFVQFKYDGVEIFRW
jgi:hypothetical protein